MEYLPHGDTRPQYTKGIHHVIAHMLTKNIGGNEENEEREKTLHYYSENGNFEYLCSLISKCTHCVSDIEFRPHIYTYHIQCHPSIKSHDAQ